MNCFKTLSIVFVATLLLASCEKKNTGNEPVDTDVFTLEDIRVEFAVDADDRTVGTIKMIEVKFAEAMPLTLDMTIAGVTVAETAEGYTISGDDIVPTAMMGPNETPFAQYTITDLEGTATEEGLTLSMKCGPSPVSYTGTAHTDEEEDIYYVGTLGVTSAAVEE